MREVNKIVVVLRFEQLIQANIAKTKLDAFGIPCFLTEENVTHMMSPLLSGGIRLHVFESDKETALQLVGQDHLAKVEDDGLLCCEKCGSRTILTNNSDSIPNAMRQAVLGFLLGFTKKHYCQSCGNEFE